ncbi:hypothetical protein [Acinetobacter gerneri]|uniref:hypothetical protein n=1 Tax=Acinetobacter gerneri TaxID=202952 RepID=UPI003A8A9105
MNFNEWYAQLDLAGLSQQEIAKMAFSFGQQSKINNNDKANICVEEHLDIGHEPKFVSEDYQSWQQGLSDFDVLESYFYAIESFFQNSIGNNETTGYFKLITQYTGAYIADKNADYFEQDDD